MFLLAAGVADAHRPIFTDVSGSGPDKAVVVEEPEVSQVIYRELTGTTPQLWLALDAEKGFKLFVQIGVPVIDRLKTFRPSFAVAGPGLPSVTLPFQMLKGSGGKLFSTEKIKKPRFFHEHFTDTDSWILRSETIELPASGRYYVVAYSPSKKTGKFWLSVGRKERFGVADLLRFGEWKRKIQAFHEVGKKQTKTMLIDDFSDPEKAASFGTPWRFVSDRVMGGVSEGTLNYGKDKDHRYLHLTGNVSLENNGGFIQAALRLIKAGKPLNATGFEGIRFRAKGNGRTYYVHLKNTDTRLPWQYYAASFEAPKEWKPVEIPFTEFKPENLKGELKRDSLSRIALVGAKKAFSVDLYVGPVELYKKTGKKQKE